MSIYDNPDYHLVEYNAPKPTKFEGGAKIVAYGYTYKPGIAEDKAAAFRRLGYHAYVEHGRRGNNTVWISGEKINARAIDGTLAVKKFKITRDKENPDYYVVSAGWAGGTHYQKTRVMGKKRAQEIAGARNRLVVKKVKITRGIRAGRKS